MFLAGSLKMCISLSVTKASGLEAGDILSPITDNAAIWAGCSGARRNQTQRRKICAVSADVAREQWQFIDGRMGADKEVG